MTPEEVRGEPAVVPAAPTLAALHAVMVRCTRCALATSRTQVVPGEGPPHARVMLVGEAPGEAEDHAGRPFVGASGRLLDRMLSLAGLRRADVFVANVVRCRPPANRAPRAAELRACAPWLRQEIRLVDPDAIVTLGRFALQHFLPEGKVRELRGQARLLEVEGRARLLAVFVHPAAVLRARDPAERARYEAEFRTLGERLRALHQRAR